MIGTGETKLYKTPLMQETGLCQGCCYVAFHLLCFLSDRNVIMGFSGYARGENKGTLCTPVYQSFTSCRSILPFHRINRNYPLFSKLANINDVYKLSIGYSFSQRAFVQPPQLRCITESH